jgi:hypothetical protein
MRKTSSEIEESPIIETIIGSREDSTSVDKTNNKRMTETLF